MTVTLAADTLRHYPLATVPRFAVEVDGVIEATFSECSALGASVRLDKWEEGGTNHTTLKFPGRTDYDNITLKHGISESPQLYQWFLQTMRGEPCRRTVTIKLFSGQETVLCSWQLINAFPVKWSGPSLQSTSNNVAIESLEFAHEGFIVEGPASLGAPPSLLGSVGGSAGISLNL